MSSTSSVCGRGVQVAAGAVVGLVASALLAVPAGSATRVSDTLSVLKDDQMGVSNAEITALLAASTPSVGDAVMVTRDDEFADALASGLLQRSGPLFTVPQDGPIPDVVRQQILAAGATRAVVLGGEAAVSTTVEEELRALDLATTRLAGGSRFDTAIAIAEAEAPDADTIMLARAFPSAASADPTQAFADTLAAGGMSARNGWPVLLTQTEELTQPTADYLARSGARRVLVLGGTAAISEATLQAAAAIVGEAVRVAGPTRFDTAVELEKFDGAQNAGDVSQVILVEGTGTNAFTGAGFGVRQAGDGPDAWAAGFAAAHRAFVFDAPILLTAAGSVPDATAEFLASGVGGDPSVAPLITCTMTGPACLEAREDAGLPPTVEVVAAPAGGLLQAGQQVRVTISGGVAASVSVAGDCAADSAVGADGALLVTVVDPLPVAPTCEIVIDGIPLESGAVQTEVLTYETGAGSPDPTEPVVDTVVVREVALPGIASVCGLAIDDAAGRLFATACDGADVHVFDLTGQAAGASIPIPSGATNDVDLDVITSSAQLGGVAVPAGSLLVVDGEVEEGAIVVDPADGMVLAGPFDLPEAGLTVGIAWDDAAQELVEASWDVDVVSRITASDLSLARQFPVAPAGSGLTWDVFFGDVEVGCSGELLLVSSSQSTILELTPDGELVRLHGMAEQLPDDELDHAAIAFDETTGEAWLGLRDSSRLLVVEGLSGGGGCG